jgi:hypothetical protein
VLQASFKLRVVFSRLAVLFMRFSAGQVRAPTVVAAMSSVLGVGGLPASQMVQAGTATPSSAVRLTMSAPTVQARQRSPAAVMNTQTAAPQVPQVLKVMGTQPGSVPQIITLQSPRTVSKMFILSSLYMAHFVLFGYTVYVAATPGLFLKRQSLLTIVVIGHHHSKTAKVTKGRGINGVSLFPMLGLVMTLD